ncbi:unnamed protein product [marine sediment metagenome]|uniref:Uncharacterized protein n=1 Tax=marine sediment metagenome TaxID=412755 RepID=X1LHP2_9ZZZZ
MTEEKDPETTPFDAEWEIKKMGRRIMDLLDMIDELKAKDKSLSARISRLKLRTIEEEGEEEPGEEREEVQRQFDELPLEEKAVLMAKLMDRRDPER